MIRTSFRIPLGSHRDSQPALRRESQRQRCAGVTAGPSSPDAARPSCLGAKFPGWHEQNLGPPVTPLFRFPHPSLSQFVRAGEGTNATACAPPTTTTDHFMDAPEPGQGQPHFADQSRAARSIARRSYAGLRRCITEGFGNRRCLPPQPHPSLSRSHEEGNVDKRVAAGGMPYRDR